MPCDMMGSAADIASANANEALSRNRSLEARIAGLEQALCGLCQDIECGGAHVKTMHPQLRAWFEAHRATPGCMAATPPRAR